MHSSYFGQPVVFPSAPEVYAASSSLRTGIGTILVLLFCLVIAFPSISHVDIITC